MDRGVRIGFRRGASQRFVATLPDCRVLRSHVLFCRKMTVKQTDHKSVEKFKMKLVDNAAKIGGVFVHYEVESGTWLMKVDHF